MGEDQKKMKVKKGYLAVTVGMDGEDEKLEKFVIPISHLYHPLFRRLLEQSKEVYGFRCSGPLKLHCSVDDFHRLRRLVERDSQNSCRATSATTIRIPWP